MFEWGNGVGKLGIRKGVGMFLDVLGSGSEDWNWGRNVTSGVLGSESVRI